MRVLAGAKVDRPVDEVQVKVLELKLGEGVVESSFDVGGVVLRVPKLRRNEDVFTFEARDIGEGTLDALGNLFLVLVTVIGGNTR